MIGGGELEQGDGSRALLVVGLVGENDAVVVDIDGLLRVSTTLFVNVDAATVSVGPSNWGVARGTLVKVHGEFPSEVTSVKLKTSPLTKNSIASSSKPDWGCCHDVLVAAGRESRLVFLEGTGLIERFLNGVPVNVANNWLRART